MTAAIGPPQSASVAAILLTYNEEANVEACLKSVCGCCQQIFVVDSGSTDKTLEICRRYTELLFFHPYLNHASQWTWALDNLPIACDWIIPLDADHVISSELKRSMVEAVLNPAPHIAAYYARHRMYFRGQPIRGFKEHTLCLFQRSRARVDATGLADQRFAFEGAIRILSGILEERNQNEWSIDFWIDKHQKHASRTAAEEILRGTGAIRSPLAPRLIGSPTERILWLKNRWLRMPLYVRPLLYFAYRYCLRLGFLDGGTGLLYHFLQAFWYRLLVDVKIGEFRRQLAAGELSLDQLAATYRESAH